MKDDDDIEALIAKRLRRLSHAIDEAEDRKTIEFAINGLLSIAHENLSILMKDELFERKLALLERLGRKHHDLGRLLNPTVVLNRTRRRRR